jgi:hypothetical protein
MVRSLRQNVSGSGELIDPAPRSQAARLGVSIFAVMSIGLLFLSYFGPLFDHHFTERQPQHTHVYFGDSAPGHTHPFETEHTHTVLFDESTPHEHSTQNTTIYLVPNDEAGPNSLGTGPTPGFQLAGRIPFDPLRSSYLAAETDLTAHSVPPPIRPPRV